MRRVFTGVRHAALGAVSGLSRPSNAGVFALSAVSRPLATAASLRPQSQSSMRIRVTKQETARAPVDAEESSEWSDVEVDSDKEVEKKAAVAKKAKVAVQTVAAPQVDSLGRAYAIGRRKTSVAQVWIKRGTGNFVVNTMPHVEYFPRLQHRIDMAQPFRLAKAAGMFDVFCTVRGGGKSGQAGAVRHGIAQALLKHDPNLNGLIGNLAKRDLRRVERKKPGKVKARKSKQWHKR